MIDMGQRLAEAVTALRFLTRLPIPGPADTQPDALACAAWAFPFAGLVVGGLAAAALWVSAEAFHLHPVAAGLIAVAVAAWASGALHEDGLADTADGFGGGADRAAKLRIMRDPRIGTFGVLALVVTVGLRATALASFMGPGLAAAGFVAACVLSRGTIPLVMALLPPVRADGLSKSAGRPAPSAWATALGLGALGVLAVGDLEAAAWATGFAILGALAVAALARRQIGGQTGDVLGAGEQAAQTCALFALAGALGP